MNVNEAINLFHKMFISAQTKSEADAAFLAVDALEKQVPKKPEFIKQIFERHDWKKNEDGNIDEFGVDYGYHNGPVCTRCGYGFCEHCVASYQEALERGPCDCSYYICPCCGKTVVKRDKVCSCGQRLEWGENDGKE